MNNIVVNRLFLFYLIGKASPSLYRRYKPNKIVALAMSIAKKLIHPFKKWANKGKIRLDILMTLEAASPIGAFDSLILSVVTSAHPNATLAQIRNELDYLVELGLVKVVHNPNGHWHCSLVEAGIVGGAL